MGQEVNDEWHLKDKPNGFLLPLFLSTFSKNLLAVLERDKVSL